MPRWFSPLIISTTVAIGLGICSPSVPAQAPKAKNKEVTAPGKLVPSETIWIYPLLDGVVRAHCKSGDAVHRGQVLVEVESAELQEKLTRLMVEIDAANTKERVLQEQIQKELDPAAKAKVQDELATVRFELRGRKEQLEQLRRMYDGGTIKAPIAGTVIIPQEEKLKGKPVKRDNPLLKVAQLDGDWHVIVPVAEADVGRLLSALKGATDNKVDVELLVHAFPKRSFKGSLSLKDVGKEMSVNEGKPVLWTKVRLAPESLKELKTLPIGANVSVRIACPG